MIYTYRGDRWTDPKLRMAVVQAVHWEPPDRTRGGFMCVRGRNGNMLVTGPDGRRIVVLGRQLRKVKR